MLEQLEDGSYSIAYSGEACWHGLGTKVPADLTPEQMMKAAGLDWTVEKTPLFTEVNGQRVDVDKTALIRTTDNKVLDVVGNDWNPVQNHEAFEFFNDFIAAAEMTMETAGSLKGGKHVWALAKINESFEVVSGDKVDGYLLFSNPHQYGKAIDVRFTSTRVCCNNTITEALRSSTVKKFSTGHRSVFNPDLAKEILGISMEKMNRYKEQAKYLSSKRYKDEYIVEYFNRIFPVTTGAKKDEGELASRAAKKAAALIDIQPGADFAPGSWWNLVNSVTFYTNHVASRSDDARLYSNWFGPNQALNLKAVETALEMASA